MEETIWTGRHEMRLTDADLERLSALQIDVIKNSFYARSGYVFRRKDLDAYFRRQKWYRPLETNQARLLTAMSNGDRADAHLALSVQLRRGFQPGLPFPELGSPDFRLGLPSDLADRLELF